MDNEKVKEHLEKLKEKVGERKYNELIKEKNIPIVENKYIIKHTKTDDSKENIDLPDNFSLYIERGKYYLMFSKYINKKRYSKKITIETNDIQKEFDKLILLINNTVDIVSY